MNGKQARRIRRMATANKWTRSQYRAFKREYRRNGTLTTENGATISVRALVQGK